MTNIVSSHLLEALLGVEASERSIRKALRFAISKNASEFEIFSYKSRLNKVREEHNRLLMQLDQLEAEGPDAMVGFFTSIRP